MMGRAWYKGAQYLFLSLFLCPLPKPKFSWLTTRNYFMKIILRGMKREIRTLQWETAMIWELRI